MFNKPIILSVICFLLLSITTSLIKNKTRNLEKDISVIKKDISLLEKQVSEAEIDFIYLSSPEKIKKNITELNKEKYLNFDHSRVFYSINHFLNHNLKETRYLNKKVRE